MKWLYAIGEMLADWYRGSIARQRHAVEEDARRLDGVVIWRDTATKQERAT